MANSNEADKYEVLEVIGKGSFGIIRKVKRKTDGHILCRKEINYTRMAQKEREQLQAEFNILNSLKHPNIVAYYHREHIKNSQDLHLYMEYCGGGDLSMVIKKLKSNQQFADEEYVWSIFTQLVTALYRCHYGKDPPEVGKNVMGPGNVVKTTASEEKNQVVILHRDLKPENVFLGADNAVKLGDFGLSKSIASHDFASTYVGTPYYMSPEICTSEKYSLSSDIWSLGCVVYELCAREPPFDAKSHFSLIQKIKEGRVKPLPNIYSPELQDVIRQCLKTNPNSRPDTTTLLNLPIVRLLRKEREVVELGMVVKAMEAEAAQKLKSASEKLASVEVDVQKMKAAIESTVRREWEVKARLEIDRQLKLETEKLRLKFEAEVRGRVEVEIQRHKGALKISKNVDIESPTDLQLSSVSTSADTDFPSGTDMSSLSIDSPPASLKPSATPPMKKARGPLSRARTQFDSPMDIQMADPSPMSIACLSLSPRRTAAAKASAIPNTQNIFSTAAFQKARWQPQLPSPAPSSDAENDEDDDLTDLPSPTRPSRAKNQDPFKIPNRTGPQRPGLLRQKTAPAPYLNPQPSLFPPPTTNLPTTTQNLIINKPAIANIPKPPSPSRRLSQLPSNTALPTSIRSGSPTRKGITRSNSTKTNAGGEGMFKAVMQRKMQNQNQGRTLVELQQARAGGKIEDGMKKVVEPVTWDPEREEMPSPFLVRGNRLVGGLGMRMRGL